MECLQSSERLVSAFANIFTRCRTGIFFSFPLCAKRKHVTIRFHCRVVELYIVYHRICTKVGDIDHLYISAMQLCRRYSTYFASRSSSETDTRLKLIFKSELMTQGGYFHYTYLRVAYRGCIN